MKQDNYIQTVKHLKQEILKSRYTIAKAANREILFLYFKIGKTISEKVSSEKWGNKTLERLSVDLQNELKGLRGFSSANLKKMRQFYETWSPYLHETIFRNEIGSTVSNQLKRKEKLISQSVTGQLKNAKNEMSLSRMDQLKNVQHETVIKKRLH